MVGTGLTAVYFVILLNRTCFGRLDSSTAYYPQVQWNERVPALVLTVLIIFLGLQPSWLVRWSEPTTAALLAEAHLSTPTPKTFMVEVEPTPTLLSTGDSSSLS